MSALPSVNDLLDLVAYAIANPVAFVTRGTVMTTSLLIAAVVVSVLPRRSTLLHRTAPSLALVLFYFGLGSILLAVEIILRFHGAFPHETEVQLVSGITHLALAVVGVAVLWPHLRDHPRIEWLWAHTIALAYWAFHVTVLTPEWFTFKGQRDIARVGALLMLSVAAAINALLWTRAPRSMGPGVSGTLSRAVAPIDRRADRGA